MSSEQSEGKDGSNIPTNLVREYSPTTENYLLPVWRVGTLRGTSRGGSLILHKEKVYSFADCHTSHDDLIDVSWKVSFRAKIDELFVSTF